MNGRWMPAAMCVAAMMMFAACSNTNKWDDERHSSRREATHRQVKTVVQRFRQRDPSIQRFFDGAYAYAVFPAITKGAVGVGAAHGYGEAYKDSRLDGYVEMSQATVGVQLGGQSYSEIVFFKDKADYDRFKYGDLEFSANASAVAAEEGAAAAADYADGVAVFTMTKSGLMFEASIGGQSFEYRPL